MQRHSGLTREHVCPRQAMTESGFHTSGLITRDVNGAGARSAVNPHAACDVAGTEDGITAATKRADSVGINRHGVANARVAKKGLAIHLESESCEGDPQGRT